MAKAKVLVVDDSTSTRNMIAHALLGAGYEVLEAVNAAQGVELVARHGDLAAVLCDVTMPDLDGVTMVELLRRTGLSSHLPIIMLTGEDQPRLMQRAKSAGAKG